MSMMVKIHINDIPYDILRKIIKYLGPKNIIKFRKCNRRFWNVITTEECMDLIHKEWSDLFNGLYYGILPESARNTSLLQEPSLRFAFELQVYDAWKNIKSNASCIWRHFLLFVNCSYHPFPFTQKALEFIESQQKRRMCRIEADAD